MQDPSLAGPIDFNPFAPFAFPGTSPMAISPVPVPLNETCPRRLGETSSLQLRYFLGGLRGLTAQQRGPATAALAGMALQGGGAGASHGNPDDTRNGVESERLSGFAFGTFSRIDREETVGGRGFDQDSTSITLGFDFRLREMRFLGASFNYLRAETGSMA